MADAEHEALLARSRVRPEQLYRLGSALAAWSEEDKTPSLEALALSSELGTRVTAALLAKLEEAGLVEREDADVRILAAPEEVEGQTRALAGQFETLRTQDGRRLDALEAYAHAEGCRAVYLTRYFGEPEGQACGLCDVCRGLPERPTGFFDPLKTPARPGGKKRRGKKRRTGRRAGSGAEQEDPKRRSRRRRRPRGRAEPGAEQEEPRRGGRRRREAGDQAGSGAEQEEPKRGGKRRSRGGRGRGRRGGRRRRSPRSDDPS